MALLRRSFHTAYPIAGWGPMKVVAMVKVRTGLADMDAER